ncbi:MAG: MFS transporter [Myxococcaceae bacterium]|nr:MFS transporter [Myxococcaceae bacterium]MCI0673711.1 MFS transporter [Myxococcaceae bacterium]
MKTALLRVRELTGGLPRAYWFVWVGTLVNRMGGFVAPFLSLYLTQERGLTVEAVGKVVACFGAGAVLGGLAGGALADRIGRRRTMLLALAGSASVMLALGAVRSVPLIVLAAFLLGFLSDLYRPAVQAMIADLVPPEHRLRAFSLYYWAINAGYAVAAPAAGALASLSFPALFRVDAAATLACAALLWWRVPESRATTLSPRPEVRSGEEEPGFSAVLADGVFLSFVALQFLLATLFFQLSTTLPLQLRAQGLTPGEFGRVMMVNGLLIVVLQPFALGVVRRFRRSHVLAVAGLLVGAGLWFHGSMASVVGHQLAVALWTLGEIANAPTASSVVADLAPPQLRGRYQGVFTMSFSLGMLVAPLGGTSILGSWGPGALWRGCLAVGVVLCVGHLLIAGARQRRMAGLRGPGILLE